MDLVAYDDVAFFLRACGAFLNACEAENNQGCRVPGLIAEAELVRRFVSAWTALNAVPRSPGRLRPAEVSDRGLIAKWSRCFSREALGRSDRDTSEEYARSRIEAQDIFVWALNEPLCMAARARPTRNGVAINHVYTPPAHRRGGYATSCVAALTDHLLASGYSFCTLYADLANRQSNDIYRRIGYTALVETAEIRLQYPGKEPLAPGWRR